VKCRELLTKLCKHVEKLASKVSAGENDAPKFDPFAVKSRIINELPHNNAINRLRAAIFRDV
jgi:hypothetical protein